MLWRSGKQDQQELLLYCRSNWLLLALRDFLGNAHERYVKWYMGGAFNGICLDGERGIANAAFHKKGEQFYRPESLRLINFEEVQMTISCGGLVDIEQAVTILRKADQDFELLEQKPFEQIRRIYVYGGFAPRISQESAKGVLEPIEKALECRFNVFDAMPIMGLNPELIEDIANEIPNEFHAEAMLDEPLRQKDVRRRLKSLVPDIRKMKVLFGFGSFGSHRGTESSKNMYIDRLIFRHF